MPLPNDFNNHQEVLLGRYSNARSKDIFQVKRSRNFLICPLLLDLHLLCPNMLGLLAKLSVYFCIFFKARNCNISKTCYDILE